jgi:hypothetical protein
MAAFEEAMVVSMVAAVFEAAEGSTVVLAADTEAGIVKPWPARRLILKGQYEPPNKPVEFRAIAPAPGGLPHWNEIPAARGIAPQTAGKQRAPGRPGRYVRRRPANGRHQGHS